MAKAFDALKPGNAAEVKKKFNIDEKKDFTKDAKCVECHVTGYGKPGGYPAIVEGKAWTEGRDQACCLRWRTASARSCHGPGSLTNVYEKNDNENYAKAELLRKRGECRRRRGELQDVPQRQEPDARARTTSSTTRP